MAKVSKKDSVDLSVSDERDLLLYVLKERAKKRNLRAKDAFLRELDSQRGSAKKILEDKELRRLWNKWCKTHAASYNATERYMDYDGE